MKVLVTGAAGNAGQVVTRLLAKVMLQLRGQLEPEDANELMEGYLSAVAMLRRMPQTAR